MAQTMEIDGNVSALIFCTRWMLDANETRGLSSRTPCALRAPQFRMPHALSSVAAKRLRSGQFLLLGSIEQMQIRLQHHGSVA